MENFIFCTVKMVYIAKKNNFWVKPNVCAILMDLSKVFDTLNYDVLIAKLCSL